ncbi:GNAT family N-acetyltransferase [Wukongibacter baidiensis]|uniref:GNAT family N-acetyltransferase n=1 Tax=Wukongibacter baidiensis TaxID=1723361 RepID=UPI003D7F357A
MEKILQSDYYKISNLLNEGIKYPEVISIIEGNNPGVIFVDDIDKPKTALVWNQGMRGFYFVGDNESKLFLQKINRFMNAYIARFLKDMDIEYFEVSGTTQSWENTIESIFGDNDLRSWKQFIYRWDNSIKIKEEANEFKYSIYSLSHKEANHHKYTNWKYYENVLNEFWGSVDQLGDKGNCYYAAHRKKIIGVCYSAFITSNIKTIGIETDEEYRKQGVGYNLALRCISDVLAEGKLPWWDCMEKNLSSRALAEKLGFVKSKEYICYRFSI